MIGSAFQPQGNTVAIVSAVTSTTAVQVVNAQSSTGAGPAQYRFVNVGAVPVFVSWGTAASGTAAAAVIPVGGTPGNGFCIAANTCAVMTLAPCAWFATIASATTSTLYITPGEGNL